MKYQEKRELKCQGGAVQNESLEFTEKSARFLGTPCTQTFVEAYILICMIFQ